MSKPKHNYSKYSVKQKPADPIPAPEKPAVKMVEETVETVVLPETVEGTVVNCTKLNVRAMPSTNAEIVCVLDAMSKIEIDVSKSTDEWFKVCTAMGADGYCMRKHVDARL